MKILLTGASGFLGSILRSRFKGMDLKTMGRSEDMDLLCDITRELPDLDGYDLVVHAAGKAHVIPRNSDQEKEFHTINHTGTLNLLTALEKSGEVPATFVHISTVAVYGIEEGDSIDETHSLDGKTPYAVSKIRAEEAVSEWAIRNSVDALILRLPLVVGKNAPGNLGAMERHINRGTYLRIGNGEARRSMVLASDVADLISVSRGKSGVFNLTDRRHPSIREIDSHMARQMGRSVRSIPPWVAKAMSKVGDLVPGSPFDSYRLEKLSRSLTFNDDKAVATLGWSPKGVLDTDFLI